MSKPTLFQNSPYPLNDLEPDKFNNFCYAALKAIGPSNGFRPLDTGPKSHDHGFDVSCERLSDNAGVCVQCKRNSTFSFTTTNLAGELAKVAIETKAEGSTVKEYYGICSGKIASDVYSKLREEERETLIKLAKENLDDEKFCKKAREKLALPKDELLEIIEDFISNLEAIVVWSGNDFNSQIASVSSALTNTIEAYFSVQSFLREYPRADFNFSNYKKDKLSVLEGKVIAKPRFEHVNGNPPNIKYETSANPIGPDVTKMQSIEKMTDFLSMPRGICIVSGAGGVGKTTALNYIGREILASGLNDLVPVFLEANLYDKDIDRFINRSLGLNHGSWRTIPLNFLFLVDGVNEISIETSKHLLKEIDDICKKSFSKSIITMKDSGLDFPVVITTTIINFTLGDLTWIQVNELSREYLSDDEAEEFLDFLFNKSHAYSGAFYYTAFSVTLMIALFKRGQKAIPANKFELVKKILGARYERAQEQIEKIQPSKRLIQEDELAQFASLVAHKLRFGRRKSKLNVYEMSVLIEEICKNIDAGFPVFSNSDPSEIIDILIHFEILKRSTDKVLGFGHDIFSDFYISYIHSKSWNEYLREYLRMEFANVWIFSSSMISKSEGAEYIQRIFRENKFLAAYCALGMEFVL